MKRDRNSEAGSALALVLIFVTILGGWLGVSLLLTQASATGGQRLSAQTASASQVAVAASTVFEQLTINPTLGSTAFDSSTQPYCGLASIVAGVSVSCVPVTGSNQSLASSSVTTTSTTGTTTGTDNGVSITGSYSFNSSIESHSNNVTVTSGNVTATQILTPSGGSISGVSASAGVVSSNVANLPTSSVTPVLPVSDPGTGITGSINLYLPKSCPTLDTPILIPSGNYNDEAIDQLNVLFTAEIIRTYKSNGSYTDKDCSLNFAWLHKVDLEFGRGVLYFVGTKTLDVNKDSNDSSETIIVHNDPSDANVKYDATGVASGCTYLHGVTATVPLTSSDVSGTQLVFGNSATLSNHNGDFRICGPRQALGQSFAIISVDSSHATLCALKRGNSSNCPAVHTGSTPLLYAYGTAAAKTFIYGTVLASGSNVRIDEGLKSQHEIDGGVVSNGAKFTCTTLSGSCAFPVLAGPTVTGRHLKITFTTPSGRIIEHEIIIDDKSGLNPSSHFSITSDGS
jgi:hypothetical protein